MSSVSSSDLYPWQGSLSCQSGISRIEEREALKPLLKVKQNSFKVQIQGLVPSPGAVVALECFCLSLMSTLLASPDLSPLSKGSSLELSLQHGHWHL